MKPPATRVPPGAEKRKPLSRREYLHLMLEQDGRCGCGCGHKLDPMGEGVQDEHLVALGFRADDPNALTNRSLWRKPCSKAKDKADARDLAKAKRLAGETCTGPTRPIPQRAGGLQSAGFRTDITRGVDGQVRARKQRNAP